MKYLFVIALIIAWLAGIYLALEEKNYNLTTCYESGTITAPNGKVFQCVWINSDKWLENNKGEQ